ncbi:hypothetical protein KA093_01610 [Candidatus Saccharibacteria bacterium]|nr:hypothetical protein [Candidatus Saccharibacteria bacterium]
MSERIHPEDRVPIDDGFDAVLALLGDEARLTVNKVWDAHGSVVDPMVEARYDAASFMQLADYISQLFCSDDTSREDIAALTYRAMMFALQVVDFVSQYDVRALNIRDLFASENIVGELPQHVRSTVARYLQNRPHLQQFVEEMAPLLEGYSVDPEHAVLMVGATFFMLERGMAEKTLEQVRASDQEEGNYKGDDERVVMQALIEARSQFFMQMRNHVGRHLDDYAYADTAQLTRAQNALAETWLDVVDVLLQNESRTYEESVGLVADIWYYDYCARRDLLRYLRPDKDFGEDMRREQVRDEIHREFVDGGETCTHLVAQYVYYLQHDVVEALSREREDDLFTDSKVLGVFLMPIYTIVDKRIEGNKIVTTVVMDGKWQRFEKRLY